MNETALLTADELAAELRIRPSTVRDWARKRLIPEVRLSRKVRRYELVAVVEALRQRQLENSKPPANPNGALSDMEKYSDMLRRLAQDLADDLEDEPNAHTDSVIDELRKIADALEGEQREAIESRHGQGAK